MLRLLPQLSAVTMAVLLGLLFATLVSSAPLGAIRQRIEENVQNLETRFPPGLDSKPDFLTKSIDTGLRPANVYGSGIHRPIETNLNPSSQKLLEEFMSYGKHNDTKEEDGYKLGYSVDDGRLKRFRYEEKTPGGLIVGEFGFHKGDGVIRGVRYTAEAGVHPKVLYEALVKFLSL